MGLNCGLISKRFCTLAQLPRITMPVKLREKMTKTKRKMEAKRSEQQLALSRSGDQNIPIISCKRPELNFYKGQTYGKFDTVPLVSRGWHSRKSDGDYFVINSHSHNPSLTVDGSETTQSFDIFDLEPVLLHRLKEMGYNSATAIQILAMPRLLNGFNVMLAAETGSGKTLAYLLPVINDILRFKDVVNRDDVYCSPLALILVPGRELVLQIKDVLNQLTDDLDIKMSFLIGGLGTKKLLLDPPVHEVDLIVSSFGIMKKLVSSGIYKISSVRQIVMDEADTMLDDSFNELTVPFLRKFKFRGSVISSPTDPNLGVQLALAGATMPRSLPTILSDVVDYDSIAKVATPNLHRLLPHVPQKFLRLKKSSKPAKLLEIVKSKVRSSKIMIFSKDSSTADFVQMFLESNGVPTVYFHGEMDPKRRYGQFENFHRGPNNCLSCTDIGSRGLDTIRVQHIINYDFPRFISDYIHRVGRVGRVGSIGTGTVTNFISTDIEVELVQKIELTARRMEDLPNVNANIKRKLLMETGAFDE